MLWSFYTNLQSVFPLATDMATTAVLWFMGDILAQKLERTGTSLETKSVGEESKSGTAPKESTIDWHRVGVVTVYAGIIWGIEGHYWYYWLDQLVASSLQENGAMSHIYVVMIKLGLEITILHPISLLMFFVCVGLLSGESIKEIRDQLSQDYKPSLWLEYMLWTPIDILNFAAISAKHQFLVVNIACLAESVILSYIKANGIHLSCFTFIDREYADSGNLMKSPKDRDEETGSRKEMSAIQRRRNSLRHFYGRSKSLSTRMMRPQLLHEETLEYQVIGDQDRSIPLPTRICVMKQLRRLSARTISLP